MTEQPYIEAHKYLEAHEHLVTALKLLTQAKVEVAKAQSAGREPYISHALAMISMAYNSTNAARVKIAQKIDQARQMPLEGEKNG